MKKICKECVHFEFYSKIEKRGMCFNKKSSKYDFLLFEDSTCKMWKENNVKKVKGWVNIIDNKGISLGRLYPTKEICMKDRIKWLKYLGDPCYIEHKYEDNNENS